MSDFIDIAWAQTVGDGTKKVYDMSITPDASIHQQLSVRGHAACNSSFPKSRRWLSAACTNRNFILRCSDQSRTFAAGRSFGNVAKR